MSSSTLDMKINRLANCRSSEQHFLRTGMSIPVLCFVKHYVNFNYLPVIPNDYIKRLIPDVDTNNMSFVHSDYSSKCFLHTPLIDAEGNVCTCHIGKVGTHLDIRKLPYFLGSLRQNSLKQIFDSSESNYLYQYLRLFGPKGIAQAVNNSPLGEQFHKKCYSGDCHMCADILPNVEVLDLFKKKFDEPFLQKEIFLRRVIELKDS
jgi:hypothetical protein